MANSPFDYRAEQKGFEVLLSIKEIAEFVKIPINGLGTPQRKIDREPDEVVRMLRALRNANLFLQNQREISGRILKLVPRSRSGSMLSTASSLTPISRYPNRWSQNGFPWEHFEQKKKNHRQAATRRRLEICRKNPTLIVEIKELPPKGLRTMINAV